MDAPIGYEFDQASKLKQENPRLRRDLEACREALLKYSGHL
jgi:uncharacterized caspase-like protein